MYHADYSDGTNHLISSDVSTSGGLADAIRFLAGPARLAMEEAPSDDWSKWHMLVTDEAGHVTRVPFSRLPPPV
jgi:hypothetical protein